MRLIATLLLAIALIWPISALAGDDTAPDIPLNVAVLTGNLDAVRQHIAAGTDLDEKDAYGSAPLTIAATFGKTEVAKALIEAGADLQVTDGQGSMPIHIAAFLGLPEIVKAFLETGADRYGRNADGATALDIALTPVDDDRHVLEDIATGLAPLGFQVDYDAVASGRAQAAEMLQSTRQERSGVDFAPTNRGAWTVATPEEARIDPDLLADLYLEAGHVRKLWGLLVVKDGRLVAEHYYGVGGIDHVDTRQSASKSILSALYGIGREKGCAPPLDARMIAFFPEMADKIEDQRKADITIGEMLKMRAGYPMEIRWPEYHDKMFFTDNWYWIPHLVDVPLMRDPGAGFGYSNLTSQLLGIVLQRACKTDLLSYARENLFGPIGAEIAKWTVGPDGYTWGPGEAFVTARDMAKFGQLYLDRGAWQGRQVVPADWVDASLTSYSKDAWTRPKLGRYFRDIGYGYQWWSARAGGHDFDFAWGHGGQLIVLLHDLDMVIVTVADPQIGLDPIREPGWEDEQAVFNLVGQFVAALPPRE